MDGKGSIKELFPTGKQLEPLVAPLAGGKVAVGQDDLTVVLNEEGMCTQKCALNWTDIPIAMGNYLALCPHLIHWQLPSPIETLYKSSKLNWLDKCWCCLHIVLCGRQY